MLMGGLGREKKGGLGQEKIKTGGLGLTKIQKFNQKQSAMNQSAHSRFMGSTETEGPQSWMKVLGRPSREIKERSQTWIERTKGVKQPEDL